MVLAEHTPDVEEATRLYAAVLIELEIKAAGDPGSPDISDGH